MSYDLAVWEGERPATDQDALQQYLGLYSRWQGEGVEAASPTPAISRFVAALLERWPDITTDAGDDSPWSDGPLINNATGPFFYFGMIFSMAEEASAIAAALAANAGLVCFDPQAEALR